MGTYKVLQDVEADDKLVGPLSLRQFIYACIAVFAGWLSFMAIAKNAAFLVAFFAPIMLFSGFLAFPWGKDQPTELWILAKMRFYLKPRKRVWDQSGAKDLVTITAPKRVERHLTDGLSQNEVQSRLGALASTLDSRGWAVKNINVSMNTQTSNYSASDRLYDVTDMPQEVTSVDVAASDDMLDASANPVAAQFDSMIHQAAAKHRQDLMSQMSQPQSPVPTQTGTPQATPQDYWFMNQSTGSVPAGQSMFQSNPVVSPHAQPDPMSQSQAALPSAAEPTSEEEALIASHRVEEVKNISNSHLKTIKTPEQIAQEEQQARAEQARLAAESAAQQHASQAMTSTQQADIINLARNDDLNISTIARQASRQHGDDDSDGEVVISLR